MEQCSVNRCCQGHGLPQSIVLPLYITAPHDWPGKVYQNPAVVYNEAEILHYTSTLLVRYSPAAMNYSFTSLYSYLINVNK